MVITNRSLVILAVVAAALLVVTVLLHSGGRRSETTFQKGALLIQGLDPAKVARITLEKDGKTLTLVRGGEGFVVGERSGYAASTKKLNELLIKCLDVRCAAKITDSPDNFKELGVGKDKPATIAVRFKDAEDKTLVGLIVGKSPERSGGNYVRLAGSDAVYASEKHLSFNAEAAAYMNTEIVKVSKDDVRSVTVGLKEGTYTVARDKDGKITLQDVPKGKHAKKWEVDNVFGAFSSLTFSDVMRASDVKVDIEATYTCRLESSLAYVAHLGRKDDKKCLKLSATAPPKESISVKIAKDEEKSELKKKEAILAAPEKAKAFSLKHKDWVYVIPDWKAEHLRKPLSELVEDIPKPDEPEEVAARSSSVTRTPTAPSRRARRRMRRSWPGRC